MKNEFTIYFDGDHQRISLDDLKRLSPGSLNGFGVFETVLYENRNVYFLEEHYRRFLYGCDRYIFPRPPALPELRKILAQLIKVNGLKNARVRISAWRKSYHVHFAVVTIAREAFPQTSYRKGFAACLYPKCFDRSPELSRIKSLDYRFFLAAYEYALQNDCHEALLLNSSGVIVEGSRSNIFIVRKNKLYTPALSSGCLAGVTRQAVLLTAKRAGVKSLTSELTIPDLFHCQEAFLTNSLIGIMPLTYLGGHKIGAGHPGPVTLRLMKAYKKLSQANKNFLV